MIPVLINNPLFRGITPEKLSANLEEISFHTRSYKKGEILARQGGCMQPPRHSDQRQCSRRNDRLFRKINKGRRYCRPQSDCPAFSVWRRKSLSGGGDSQRTDRGYRNS